MECPYCDSELIYNCQWGQLASHQSGEVFGHIYICPKAEGFETEEEAMEYLNKNSEVIDSSLNWEEIVCDSSSHHVSGSFYTDQSGDLKEGYPC